jgi:WD40 repeat protein
MSRCDAILAFLLIASPAWAQDPPKQGNQPRLDLYGDPLPPGVLRRLGTIRFRQEYVHDMAFTPDGKSLVVASAGRLVKWEVATGKPLRIIRTSPSGNYRSLGLSRDGHLVAVRPDNSSVVVLDLSTGKERFRKNVGTQYPGGVISPDNSLIAIGSTDRSSLWNLQTGKEHAKLRGTEDLKFSPDGMWLAGRFREPREEHIILVDPKTGQERNKVKPINTKNLEEVRVSGFGFTPDGQSLVVSWWDSGILIYDLKNQKVARRLETDAQLVAISPDSKILAATKERTVILTSIETGKEIRRWQVNDKFLAGAYGAFSPDGKTLALGFECGIQLWDPETGKRLDSFRGPVHIPQYLALSDDAKTVAVLYGRHAGQLLQLFDTETLQEKARIDAKPFTLEHLAFSPDGRRLAFQEWPIIDRDKHPPQVRLMDVDAGKEITPAKKILGLFSHWKGRDTIVVVANTTRDGQTHWIAVNAANGQERHRTPIPKGFGMSIHRPSSPNEPRRIVVVNDRGDRNVPPDEWDRMFVAEWSTGQRIRPLVFAKADKDHHFFGRRVEGFSPDERLILTSDIGLDITFSEAATGHVRFQMKSEHRSEFLQATFSPAGRLIVVSREGKHTILDSLTFEPLMEFVPWTYYGSCFGFSANGKIMVTGDTSSLLVWDLKAALRPRKTSPDKLSAAQLRELWSELENADARIGHRAMITLSRRPEEAIATLKSRLPASKPDAATFQRLVRELDDPSFKTREAARIAITQMGESAGAMIRQALKDPPSLELKRRLTALAEKLKFSDGDRVRWLRCVELLERIGTPGARATIELFRNFSDPETSADATRSLARLAVLAR